VTRWYGKYHSAHLFEHGNLEGRTLICIKQKYANFTLGKEYPVTVRFRHLDGRPADFTIVDDDGDTYPIGVGAVGKMFEIKHQ
jgi:hypothetical protein